MLRFTNCHLCDKGRLIANEDLYVDTKSGKIVDWESFNANPECYVVDLGGEILAPGFLDIQNNGVYGVNFSLLPGNATIQETASFEVNYRDVMAKYLCSGVTALCPTMTSSTKEVYQRMLPLFGPTRYSDRTDSLGAHLEGPFINITKKGCHPQSAIAAATGCSVVDMYGSSNLKRNVAVVTLAPEILGIMDQIADLANDVVISIGHTLLDAEATTNAVCHGVSMITHLYNAMPQPHHRNSGVIGAISTSSRKYDSPYFGLICDGIHVSPDMCVLAFRADPSKCVLVTDAMHLIGLPDGLYVWGQQKIEKKGHRLVLEGTDTLAGAAADLAQCVRNLMTWSGTSLAEAVRTVTNNAANSLNIKHKGYLDPGCDADMVVLSNGGEVLDVYKLGKLVKTRGKARL